METGGPLQAVGVIQDIVTRWWSTLASLERLLRLKPYIRMGVHNGKWTADRDLSDEQWNTVDEIVQVLEPFKVVQQLLEGETYVTCSLIPTVIIKLRKHLEKIVNGNSVRHGVRTLANAILLNFNIHWGSGIAGTVATEHQELGPKRRPKGLQKKILLAAAIDPRTAKLGVLAEQDRLAVQLMLKQFVVAFENEFQQNALVVGVNPAIRAPVGDGDMLMNFFEDDVVPSEQPALIPPMDITVGQRIELELAAFAIEVVLPLKYTADDDKVLFSNPLEWWKLRCQKYPILSRVARALLCITATSAPSERLFSSAGLTIANRRARMHGDNAAALIFLHAALPVVKRLEAERLLGDT